MTSHPIFSSQLAFWRARAVAAWEDEVHAWQEQDANFQPDADNSWSSGRPKLPEYFLDRYAYRIFKLEVRGQRSKLDLDRYRPLPERDWIARLESSLASVRTVHLSPPKPKELIRTSERMRGLLARWRGFLTQHRIDYPEDAFCDPAGMSWAVFFKRFAHYPNRPAILAPTFIDRLSERERESLLTRVGIDEIQQLYLFLVQVHEESHLLQRGEPMLSEFHLAWLWCQFLDSENLWWWQRSADLGTTFNQEYSYVSGVRLPRATVTKLLGDTFDVVASLYGSEALPTYDMCCDLAWQFDHGKLRYREYLRSIASVYANGVRIREDVAG